MKKLMLLAAVATMLAHGASAQPVVGGGWVYDQVDQAGGLSESSPYTFTLVRFGAVLRITDYFTVGDIYTVFDNGVPILTTAFDGRQNFPGAVGDPNGELGWESPDYSHGRVFLDVGPHVITVEGNGAGGLPAGFYDRLDSVPDAASSAGLLSVAVAGLGLARRRFCR